MDKALFDLFGGEFHKEPCFDASMITVLRIVEIYSGGVIDLWAFLGHNGETFGT